MAAHPSIRTVALAALLLAAVSCVYPFEVEYAAGELPIVIEGDVHVGDVASFTLSRVHNGYDEEDLSGQDEYFSPADCFIEGEDGTRIPARTGGSRATVLRFDTSAMRDDVRYRIHFRTVRDEAGTGDLFETDWIEVCKAPVIDALSYHKNDEFGEMRIGLSMHCQGYSHFRWSFSETWEYHSNVYTDLYYDPHTNEIRNPRTSEDPVPNLYYCWKATDSPVINIFSTERQVEDRFEDLDFHRIPLSDQRLQVMYRITVRMEAMSKEAYAYWNNIRQNSEEQGSFFAPMPSQMQGNIHCVSNPDRQAIGYISIAMRAVAEMYYDNSVAGFYNNRNHYELDEQEVANQPDLFPDLYVRGYLPYSELFEGMSIEPSGYLWGRAGCLDCRVSGGTKDKPAGWPNSHN